MLILVNKMVWEYCCRENRASGRSSAPLHLRPGSSHSNSHLPNQDACNACMHPGSRCNRKRAKQELCLHLSFPYLWSIIMSIHILNSLFFSVRDVKSEWKMKGFTWETGREKGTSGGKRLRMKTKENGRKDKRWITKRLCFFAWYIPKPHTYAPTPCDCCVVNGKLLSSSFL